MRYIFLALSIISLLFTSICVHAQSINYKTREKIHIHFDKPAYTAGDTIWLKAYVVLEGSNKPSDISKVLHIDLINTDAKITESITLPIMAGAAAGDIALADTLKHGIYQIRAYTAWQQNFSSEAFFEKRIPIVSAKNSFNANTSTVTDSAEHDVQFFPEGGDLVMGLRSKVGIKITAANGNGLKIKGKITDQDDKEVAVFNTSHLGIGSFPLTPKPGKNYTAQLKLDNNKTLKVPVKSAVTQGYVLSVNNQFADSLLVTITPDAAFKNNQVLLVAQRDNDIYYQVKISLTGGRYTTHIPKKYLPVGISRITLLTAESKPVAERLVFNHDDDPLKIAVKSITANKDSVEISMLDKNGNTVNGSFSVAVSNADQVPVNDDDELSINAQLLLTSDLKGNIQKPNYYFTATNHQDSLRRNIDLDNLLLTQGWRRFLYYSVADSTKLPNYLPEQGLQISGRLVDKKNNPIQSSKVSAFSVVDGLPFFRDTLTNANGRFTLDGLDNYGDLKFSVQAKDVKNVYSVKILLDTPAIPEIKPLLLQPDTVLLSQVGQYTASHIGYKKLNLKGTQLSEVNIIAKKKVYSSNPAGPGSAEKTLGTDVLKRYDSLRMALESNTTFILFDINNQPYIDKRYSKRFRTIKQFVTILDGMQVHNDYLQLVHPNDIESVEIVMRQVNYPDKGLIVINTKKKSTSYNWANDAVPGVTIANLKGYTAYREFYIPKFKTNETIADNRDVVYWNADIVPNENGKAGIALSNLYKPGNYRIVVEGISANGNIGRVVYQYKSDTNP